MCKQTANKECIKAIEKNFNPDVTTFDSKIKAEKENLTNKLELITQEKMDENTGITTKETCTEHTNFVNKLKRILED